MANARIVDSAAAPAEPVRLDLEGASAVLHLEGVVGIAQAKALRTRALEAAASGLPVVVRCEHLQYLDCAAAQVMAAFAAQLAASGVPVQVLHLPDSVHQMLRTAGLESALATTS